MLFTRPYRSPSQKQYQFCDNLYYCFFNINDLNANYSIVNRDFDARSSKWSTLEKISTQFLTLCQPAFTCSKLTIEILEQGVKYVQS